MAHPESALHFFFCHTFGPFPSRSFFLSRAGLTRCHSIGISGLFVCSCKHARDGFSLSSLSLSVGPFNSPGGLFTRLFIHCIGTATGAVLVCTLFLFVGKQTATGSYFEAYDACPGGSRNQPTWVALSQQKWIAKHPNKCRRRTCTFCPFLARKRERMRDSDRAVANANVI